MKSRVGALGLTMALVAAACGGSEESATTGTDLTANTIDPTTATTSAPSTTQAESVPVVTAGGPIEPIPSPPPSRVITQGEPAYTGVLGNLDPDRWVVEPRAAAPSAIPGAAPLTGLPIEEDAVSSRPAIVVKIDNSGPARPQVGLVSADIVIEERVEGGSTRFAAIVHSQSTPVGPVRSARSTDVGILAPLNRPAFVWSGANKVFAPLIREQNIIDAGASALAVGFSRDPNRRNPSNLMSDTEAIWGAIEGDPPAPQFAYRDEGEAVVGGEAASSVDVSFPQNPVAYEWDGEGWVRQQGGSPHVVADGTQIAPANVVVQQVEHISTGLVDPVGSDVTEDVILGEGPAWVFTDGMAVEGIWNRPTLNSVTTFTASDGSVIELTPGRTWVEYVDAGEIAYS